MPFNLYTSNRLEVLADALVEAISRPLPSVFDKEIIVMQSRGMQRWLSLQLAKKQGICTNIHFPFPNKFVHEIFAAVIPGISEVNKFEPQILTWQIMQILPKCLAENSFRQLSSYLEEPAKDLKRLQLSARVADLFDQY